MQSQKRLALVVFFGLALAWVTLPPSLASQINGQAPQAKPSPVLLDCGVIDELDNCIQARFSKIDGTFGLARVIPFPRNVHFGNFRPETDEEQAAVAALQQAGWQVTFFLAGRQVLEPLPERQVPVSNSYRPLFLGLSIPVNITFRNASLTPSDYNQLRAQAQRAFEAFAKQDRYDFSIANLAFTARPIRAQETCLKCHNDKPAESKQIEGANETIKIVPLGRENLHAYSKTPLKVGDALGAAIYAYTKTKQ